MDKFNVPSHLEEKMAHNSGSAARIFGSPIPQQWLPAFHRALVLLTTNFRNRAAHVDELSKADYDDSRDFVIGSNGLLWRLATVTVERRR